MTNPRAIVPFLMAAVTVAHLRAETPRTNAPKPPVPPRQSPSPKPPPATKRNIAGPGDYNLRVKIVRQLGQDPDLGKEAFSFVMVNGGAVFSGPIKNCALKMRALRMAASARGVINVTDEMSVPRTDLSDAALHKAVTDLLREAKETLELRDLEVTVEDTVASLSGTVRDYNARVRAEGIAGTVLGVTRVVNRLRPADAPAGTDDASLARVVAKYLGDFRQLSFPAEIQVKAEHGVVTLTGRATHYMGRQQAAVLASLVGGVTRVDNHIKVDPSLGIMIGTTVKAL